MRILTLNLHALQEKNQIEKLNKIAQFITDYDIDLCFFQEAAQHYRQPKKLANIRRGNNAYLIYQQLSNQYEIYFEAKKRGYNVFQEGLAIISKHPIVQKSWFYTSKARRGWITRIVLKVTIDYHHQLFDCFDVHMGWDMGKERFMDQSEILLKEIKHAQNKVILAGDFNISHAHPYYQYFITKGFRSTVDKAQINTIDYPTFIYELDSKEKAQNRHIDFIFLDQDFILKDYKLLFDKEDEHVSDHNLVYSEIEFN